MSNDTLGTPTSPDDDRPNELQTDYVSEPATQEGVRRHIARRVARALYPYAPEGESTPEDDKEVKQLREQTVASGPEAIREAENVVDVEHRRLKHLYEASDGKDSIRIEDFVQHERKDDEHEHSN